MADISMKRTHHLGLKGARAAADKMADKLGEKFDLTGDWKGNTLSFTRPGVNGSLVVSETEMLLDVTLGFMLKMMKGPIEKAVHEQLDKVLDAAPAKPAAKVATPTAKTKPAPAAKPASTAKKPAAKKK
ncbi:MAG: polyhydroxyalkanoic acid system family protein [Betaproteobacteria bacterium]